MNSTLTKIFLASIEYHFSPESAGVEKHLGGFVYCFVRASNKQEAMKRVRRELHEQSREIVEVEFLELYDSKMEWETKAETLKFKKLSEKAAAMDIVVFDTFHEYKKME